MISAKEAGELTWKKALDTVTKEDVEMVLFGIEALIKTSAAEKKAFVEVDMSSLRPRLRDLAIDKMIVLGYKVHGCGHHRYIFNWMSKTGIS